MFRVCVRACVRVRERGIESSEMLGRVDWYIFTDPLKDFGALFCRISGSKYNSPFLD